MELEREAAMSSVTPRNALISPDTWSRFDRAKFPLELTACCCIFEKRIRGTVELLIIKSIFQGSFVRVAD